MPLYTFHCPDCECSDEFLLKHAELEGRVETCVNCGGEMVWQGMEKPTLHGPAYQMQTFDSQGRHTKGHFGKEAKRNRRKK